MKAVLACAALAVLIGTPALAQTKEETMDYIVREVKALETATLVVRDVRFTDDGKTFSYGSLLVGQKERTLSFPVDGVNYFVTETAGKGGPSFSLSVEGRGRTPVVSVSGQRGNAPKAIAKNLPNGTKLKSLEKAFKHLAALLTGRKELF